MLQISNHNLSEIVTRC